MADDFVATNQLGDSFLHILDIILRSLLNNVMVFEVQFGLT